MAENDSTPEPDLGKLPACLIVTVDTEEEFDWARAGLTRRWGMTHVRALPKLQALCESHGVKPTYVIDHPVADSDEAVEILGEFHARGACEIGAHLHPWLNPPQEEELSPRNTFLCNLPLGLQHRKLAALTDRIAERFQDSPTTFKAGRYGIDRRLAPGLRELGYTVDTSMIAYCDFSAEGGPSFAEVGCRPFWLEAGGDSPREPLLEVPCTVGFSRPPFDLWARWHRRLSRPALRPLHPVGILDRLNVVRKIVLSPELAPLPRLLQLAGAVRASDGPQVYNITLHSPSAEPGHTPTVQTEAECRRLYDGLQGLFERIVGDWGATPVTLRQYHRLYRNACPPSTEPGK